MDRSVNDLVLYEILTLKVVLQIKTPVPGMGKVIVSQRGPIDPQVLKAIATSLGYPSEHYGKTLLFKTPHTRVIEHEDIKVVLTWKLHPYWVAFIVLKGTVQLPEEKTSHQSSPAVSSSSYNND